MDVKRNYLIVGVVFFCLSLADNAVAQQKVFTRLPKPAEETKEVKKVELKIKPAMSGTTFANDIGERINAAAFRVGADLNLNLSPILDVTSSTWAIMVAGQSLTRFGDGTSTSGVYLKEALINIRPVEFLSLHAGAINQGYLNNPLLISDSAVFPGIKEKLFFKSDIFNLSLIAEQTIPTSNTLSTKAVDKEEAPSFLAETISVETKISRHLDFEVFGTLYHFQNLPSKVAAESAVLGNSQPAQLTPNTAEFSYEFNGWLAGAATKIKIAPEVKLIFSGSAIENSQAPDSANHGQLLSASTEIKFSKNLVITPSVENFFNESDTSPASYNSYAYGHNNRQGFGTGLTLDFPESKFKVVTKYATSDVINESFNQGKQQFLRIILEASYDVL
ncbi:MAG: hypothetical protein IPM57_05445 [Oligoflexia bacterium]|nr:hypothetical protein [Oligoflexia bacterium]